MKIVVFGAGGRIGRKLVSGGIARGHEVTAAVQRPEDMRARVRVTEALVRASGLEWTLVHVAQLTDGEALGRYRTAEGDSLPEAPTLRISRADVADFILKELERRGWVGRDAALAY